MLIGNGEFGDFKTINCFILTHPIFCTRTFVSLTLLSGNCLLKTKLSDFLVD